MAEIAKIVDFEGESANLYSESRQERVDLATLGLPSSITAQSGIVSGGETSGSRGMQTFADQHRKLPRQVLLSHFVFSVIKGRLLW